MCKLVVICEGLTADRSHIFKSFLHAFLNSCHVASSVWSSAFEQGQLTVILRPEDDLPRPSVLSTTLFLCWTEILPAALMFRPQTTLVQGNE